MKLIIPMAGFGTRLRPHSLTRPKPFVQVAGKAIIEHLVDSLVDFSPQPILSMVFIIGDFGQNASNELQRIAKKHRASCHLFYQKNKLGLAHAINCASEQLQGPCFLAFSDSLFSAPKLTKLPLTNCIWVKAVADPSSYGVALVNEQNEVAAIVEKPQKFVSELAIIGIYYFEAIQTLQSAIQTIIHQERPLKGEYSFADALSLLIEQKQRFQIKEVDNWMDGGTLKNILKANQLLLQQGRHRIHPSVQSIHSKIIPPCSIAEGVRISNTIVGPFVSIESNSELKNCILQNSIIGANSYLENIVGKHCHIGSNSKTNPPPKIISCGDFSQKSVHK